MTALSDPTLPLHRYRIQGYLSEIRAADLAMTVPEIEQLLALHGLSLTPSEITLLAERTEGWFAGVRLSAMRMEGNAEPGRFATDFAMDRGSIGEYLMEEVLANQPREVQRLLIRSSICDPISGPLADAIDESESGNAILSDLAAKNALVMALDREGARYRYHPLLREVLRHLLKREPAAVQRRGQENAARWHAAEGNLVEALHHSVAAQDWEFCTDLLTRGAFEELFLRATGRPISGIGRFADATPDPGQEVGWGAGVVAAQAAVSVGLGRYDRATALLDGLEPSRLDEGSAVLYAFARLLVARQDGDAKRLEEAATVLVDHDGQGAFGTFALYERGSLHLWQGSDTVAETLLQQALKQATAKSLHAIALRCVGRLAIAHCTAGRVSLADEFLSQGAALLQAHPWIPEEFRVAYHLGGAEVALMHGDLDLYSRFLRLVDAALAPKTDPALSYMQALIRAKAYQSAGRYAEARDILLTNTGRELPSAWVLRIRADILLLELQAQMGKPQKAIERLESLARVHESMTQPGTVGCRQGPVRGAGRRRRQPGGPPHRHLTPRTTGAGPHRRAAADRRDRRHPGPGDRRRRGRNHRRPARRRRTDGPPVHPRRPPAPRPPPPPPSADEPLAGTPRGRPRTVGPRAAGRPRAHTAGGAAHRARDLHPELADHHDDDGRDRDGALRLDQHGQDPRGGHLPQARGRPTAEKPSPTAASSTSSDGYRAVEGLPAQVPRARQAISPPRYDVAEAQAHERCHRRCASELGQ